MIEWDEITLEEVCEKVTDGSHQSPKAYIGGYPMLSVKDMNEFGFDVENSKQISREDYLKLSKQGCKPEINDILIAKDGSVLKHIFMVKEELEAVLLSSIAIVRPIIDKIYPKYLVYSIVNPSFKKYILNNFLSGSGVPRIVLKDFKKITFNLPPLPEQKAIANVLTAFDDKIELLQQQNNTLETLAQTIFKEWFGKYQVGDELPEGFEEVTLKEIIESANTGLDAIKRAPIVEEDTGVKCFRIQDASQKKQYSNWGNTRVEDKNYKRFKLLKGDILIARTGNTIGVNYLVKEDLISVFNNGIIRLRTNSKSNYPFLYNLIISRSFEKHIQAIAYGTSTQPNMQINSLLSYEFLLPPITKQKSFEGLMKPILEKQRINLTQIQSLTKTRDTLLPKLMSGQVRVKM